MPQFLIALAATWKAGAIVVPVNPMLTQRERAVILDDSGRTAADRARVAGRRGDADVTLVVTTSELDYLGRDVPPLLRGVRARPRAARPARR